MPSLRKVGHKGADLIVPGNTLESFDAARAAGVDMIEFDVLPERGTGRLILAHDPHAAARAQPPMLEEGLAYLSSEEFAGIELDVDLKAPGYELRVVEALRAYGLVSRAIVSSQYMRSLHRVREAEPALRLGWSVPRAGSDYTDSPLTRPVALAYLAVYRAFLPARARRAIAGGRCDAIMAHWRLVTPALVEAVRQARGEIYVWTVDKRAQIDELEALGVTGVITNDPRLFAAPA